MAATGKTTSELDFEEAIESYLVGNAGYEIAPNTQFDAELEIGRAHV